MSTDTQVQTNAAKRVLTRMRWRLVPFLFLLYIVAYLDRINVGFAALQMKDQLGFSDAVYGLGMGIFFLGYFIFQVPSNLVLERVGARRWIATLMLLWGAISSAMCLAHSELSFYSLRFLLGAAEAGFFPGVIYYLRRWFPPAARAGVVAIFMTAGPASGIVGGPLSGALLGLSGRSGLAGWQWMFLIEGIPAILLGIVAWMYLIDRPESAPWLDAAEKQWLQGELDAAESTGAPGEPAWSWLTSSRLWRFAVVYFGLNTCSYGVGLWLPSALKSLSGLSNLLVGLVSMVPYLVAVLIMVLVGVSSDRTGERRWHVALSAFGGAAALLTAGFSSGLTVSVTAFGFALAAAYSMVGPFWALANANWSSSTAAKAIALVNSLGNLGSGFGPYWIGYLRDKTSSFRAGLWSAALLLAIAGFTVLTIRKESAPTARR